MDRLIYVAMSGAKHTLERKATAAHNLANSATTGYRAQASTLRALPVEGEGARTRTLALDASDATDFTPGAIQKTGRELDVAVQGKGFIAVQGPDGGEAYTRNGSLQVGVNGLLQTASGANVIGDGGPIAIPPNVSVTIGKDGTVSSVPNGTQPNALAVLGRIKLVNPAEAELVRGGDGLFRTRDGAAAPASGAVALVGSALESSNVNVVEAMVEMIGLARQFELQMKMLQSAEANERQASQMMGMNR